MSLRSIKYFFLSALLAQLTWPAFSQQHPNLQKGFSADKVYQFAEFDSVNLFNGNVNISIPIGQQYKVDGALTYGLALTYNSKAWDFEVDQYSDLPGDEKMYTLALPNRRSNAGMGWQVSLGRLIPPGDPTNHDVRDQWIFESPDGAEHHFVTTTQEFSYAANTGAYLRMRSYEDGAYRFREVHTGDGIVRKFLQSGSEWRLVQIADASGNYATVSHIFDAVTGKLASWLITEQSGREQRIFFRAYAGSSQRNYQTVLDRVELTAFSGETATYSFTYRDASVERGCGSTMVGSQSLAIGVPVLTTITLPDGSTYQLDVYDTSTIFTCRQGLLSQVVLPTKGKISYGYQTYKMYNDECGTGHLDLSPGIASRTYFKANDATADAVWTYTTALQEMTNTGTQCPSVTGTGQPRDIQAAKWMKNSIAVSDRDGNLLKKSQHFFTTWPRGDAYGLNYLEVNTLGLSVTAGISNVNASSRTHANGTVETRHLSSQDCTDATCAPHIDRRFPATTVSAFSSRLAWRRSWS